MQKPTDRVCQEEVFGPFVAVTTFKDEAEVVAIANGTAYGLGGGLWTSNLQRAHRVARAMISGDGVGQLLQARKSRLTVRRRARFRLWARDGLRRDARVHDAEVSLDQHGREHSTILQEIEMQNPSDESLTKAALERIAQCPDPRLRGIDDRASSLISIRLRERYVFGPTNGRRR